MIIGFSGSQSGMTPFQQEEFMKLLEQFKPTEFHHGDCIGSDLSAHKYFVAYHITNDKVQRKLVIHPPENNYKRAFAVRNMKEVVKDTLRNCLYKLVIEEREPFAYLTRNRHIVEACQLLIATPKEFDHTYRSGTWTTIRHAWKLKRQYIIIPPKV